MKREYLFPYRYQPAIWGGIASLVLLLNTWAGSPNLLKNGGFEAPFPVADPKAGWSLVYVDGGADDFAIAGQTTEASRTGSGRGAGLRPNNFNSAHAYFKQVVTGLKPGARYTLTGLRMDCFTPKYLGHQLNVYMAAISGTSSNAVCAQAGHKGAYSLTVTAGSSGQIEVQLHMAKRIMFNEGPEDMKHAKCSTWFDDFSLTPAQ